VSFVDAYALVYAAVRNAPFRDRARDALARLGAGDPLSVSHQILREYIAVMTRPQIWGKALTLTEATRILRHFVQRFTVFEDALQCGIG
jgi:predicted nucleic acid-binding protein